MITGRTRIWHVGSESCVLKHINEHVACAADYWYYNSIFTSVRKIFSCRFEDKWGAQTCRKDIWDFTDIRLFRQPVVWQVVSQKLRSSKTPLNFARGSFRTSCEVWNTVRIYTTIVHDHIIAVFSRSCFSFSLSLWQFVCFAMLGTWKVIYNKAKSKHWSGVQI
jgi:hypothetical protein